MADGTINDVIDWVRGGPAMSPATDGWQDRATQAIAEEHAKGDGARPTLIAKLEAALVDAADLTDDVSDGNFADEVETASAVEVVPEGDGTIWMSENGREWHVALDSEAHKQLVAKGAEIIEGPSPSQV